MQDSPQCSDSSGDKHTNILDNYPVPDSLSQALDTISAMTKDSIALQQQGDFDQAIELLKQRYSIITQFITKEALADLNQEEEKRANAILEEVMAQDLLQSQSVKEKLTVANQQLSQFNKRKRASSSYMTVQQYKTR